MFGVRRLIVSRQARPRGQRLIHWRYVVYLPLMGPARFYPYRLWLWNRTIAYRELNRRARAERDARLVQRERELKKIAYIRRTAPLRAAAIALESEGWRVTGPEDGLVGWNAGGTNGQRAASASPASGAGLVTGGGECETLDTEGENKP